jgi:NAD(P)-dependent dehydrogenase (short-subunit alcohol dehydrogenase family)
VNCISPGYIYTELTKNVRQDWQERWMNLSPLGRFGKPEELCGAVIYLLSDSASFTSGADLVMDGCFTVV